MTGGQQCRNIDRGLNCWSNKILRMSRGGRDETKCWGKQAPWCCAYHGSCDFGRCRRRLRGHLCGLLQGIWHCSCLSDSTKRLGVSLKEKEKRSRIAQRGKSNHLKMFEKVNLFLIFQFWIIKKVNILRTFAMVAHLEQQGPKICTGHFYHYKFYKQCNAQCS